MGGTLLGLAALLLGIEFWVTMGTRLLEIPYGSDLHIYTEATARYLAGNGFYLPHELAGPFTLQVGDVLYPPITMLLFAPFLVLPAVLWWAIPFAVTGYVIYRLRPSVWGWTGILLALAAPYSLALIAAGNPVMWVTAFVALGTLYRWPYALVLLKPTLAPLALLGIRDRRWWLIVGVGFVVSLPMLREFVAVMLNVRQNQDTLGYVALNVPLVLVPLIARASRRW